MPISRKQQQAAGAELARRRRGVKKLKNSTKLRPLGNVSIRVLKDLATKK